MIHGPSSIIKLNQFFSDSGKNLIQRIALLLLAKYVSKQIIFYFKIE